MSEANTQARKGN